MGVTRAQIVTTAREWLGTPTQHQQHSKGVAVDCIGLVRGVCDELGLYPDDPAQVEDLAEVSGYAPAPDGRREELMARFFDPIPSEQMQPGDIVLIAWQGRGDSSLPQHIGILGDYVHGGLSLIHAENYTRRCVVEHRLWLGSGFMRLVAAFSVRGVQQ